MKDVKCVVFNTDEVMNEDGPEENIFPPEALVEEKVNSNVVEVDEANGLLEEIIEAMACSNIN